jgi:phage gp36-like protein
MPYADHDDLINRHGEDAVNITFDRLNTGSLDTDAEAAALDDASGEIDGYLAGVYTLPLATVPVILTQFCCDIAIYRGAKGTVVSEECRRRYEDAIRYLSKVAEGKIRLFSNDPSAPNGGSGATFVAGERIMTREKMRDVR